RRRTESLKGSPEGGPVVPLWKPRTNGRLNDKRDCRVRDPCALVGPGAHFSSPLKVAVRLRICPRLQAWPRRHRVEAQGLHLPFRPLSRLAQDEEPCGSGGEARRGTRLGQMICTHFASRVERWGEKIGRPKEKGGPKAREV